MGKDIILRIAGDYGTEAALYKAAEFTGPVIRNLSLAGRWTICNMAAEIGCKFAIMEADEKVYDFLKGRTDLPFTPVSPDPDARYAQIYQVDVTNMSPQVACPHDPSNVKPVEECRGIPFHQAVIGSSLSVLSGPNSTSRRTPFGNTRFHGGLAGLHASRIF